MNKKKYPGRVFSERLYTTQQIPLPEAIQYCITPEFTELFMRLLMYTISTVLPCYLSGIINEKKLSVKTYFSPDQIHCLSKLHQILDIKFIRRCEMSEFIKGSSLPRIKTKLCILYLLNVIDLVFTQILIGSGSFVELNFLMFQILDNLFLCFLVKLLVPALLLIYIFYRMKGAEVRQLKSANLIINGITLIYFLCDAMHLTWFILLNFSLI
jgi:hypothetical protein